MSSLRPRARRAPTPSAGRRLARRLAHVAACALAACIAACSAGPADEPLARPGRTEGSGPASAGTTAPLADDRPRIVVLGDSLTSGYGISPDEAFPAHLQQRLDEAGLDYQVINMGVSGDTSAGGLRRLDWALEGDVRVLVVALGGNDGLRGLSPEQLEQNLTSIVQRARARDIDVLLCGMEAPPNFGEVYTRAFRQVYRRVARDTGVVLLPFLLDGVAGIPAFNQPDGIHPTAEGADRIAALVWRQLEPMLQERGTQ